MTGNLMETFFDLRNNSVFAIFFVDCVNYHLQKGVYLTTLLAIIAKYDVQIRE